MDFTVTVYFDDVVRLPLDVYFNSKTGIELLFADIPLQKIKHNMRTINGNFCPDDFVWL